MHHGAHATMSATTPAELKNDKLIIRCRPQSARRFKVLVADADVDQETMLNILVDNYRVTHPGTLRPQPGRTFGLTGIER